ncbi:hypothetical protein AB0D13_26970 [Streptomyces sp. NPDC048430]|uniref:hypothetical protein n=1 Tax=Streptomyces sp. NPDC048430 TaxID=3155388 RepID=UPI003443BFCF
MNEGSFTWQTAAQQIDARIEELRPEADRHVVGQHVISKVLLKRFATPFGSHGLKLVPFNLDHPDRVHKLASPRECGKVPLGLIRFDGHSRSGVQPREDVHHGEHGEEEASPPSPFVHAGVQGRDRRAVPTR